MLATIEIVAVDYLAECIFRKLWTVVASFSSDTVGDDDTSNEE